MRVINIMGGPGTGKSTTAAGVFREMKIKGYEVELVTEYAKDMTWENRHNILEDQLYILAKQNRRIQRLQGKVEWVVTDSPLLLGLIYCRENYYKHFEPLVMDVWNSYDNTLILLGRDFEYQPIGRNQTAEEALKVDVILNDFLDSRNIPYQRITNDPQVDRITQILDLAGVNSGS